MTDTVVDDILLVVVLGSDASSLPFTGCVKRSIAPRLFFVCVSMTDKRNNEMSKLSAACWLLLCEFRAALLGPTNRETKVQLAEIGNKFVTRISKIPSNVVIPSRWATTTNATILSKYREFYRHKFCRVRNRSVYTTSYKICISYFNSLINSIQFQSSTFPIRLFSLTQLRWQMGIFPIPIQEFPALLDGMYPVSIDSLS